MTPIARSALVFHGSRVLYAENWREPIASIGLVPKTDWSMLAPGRAVSRSPFTRCYRVVPPQGTPIYCKFYIYRHRRRPLPWPVPSRAAVEAWAYQRIEVLGIPTVEVLAVGEARRFGLLEAAAIVTREVSDSVDLARFARDVWLHMSVPERRSAARQIAESLISQLRRAHAAGFYHQDLKWRNVLVRPSDGVYETIWIDCPCATERRVLRHRGRVLDLSGLARLGLSYLSPVDRLRFLHAYLGPAASPGKAKSLYRAVEARLDRRPPVPVLSEPIRIGPLLPREVDGPLIGGRRG